MWMGRIARASAGLAGLAFVVLIVYGLLARATSHSIDERLQAGRAAPVPAFRLAVLEHGGRHGPGAAVRRALSDGWLSPGELRGRPYLLNLWASWCVPCRQEVPLLARASAREPRSGVLFVGIDQQDVTGDARSFLRRFGVGYPTIRDPGDGVARSLGATGVPETYFVDAGGKVVDHVIGALGARQLQAGLQAAVTGRVLAPGAAGASRPLR
jgi:thiol-disulfide isomerase/thioredoxin